MYHVPGVRHFLISIHALREEGDSACCPPHPQPQISIHALREEGDQAAHVERVQGEKFLSTPSVRRATCRAPS